MQGTCGVQANVITFNASISACRQCWPRALFLHAQLGVVLERLKDTSSALTSRDWIAAIRKYETI